MIEVVLASVLMGMISVMLVSGLGYVHASHRRHESQLGAAEMANRIMLQFLDSAKSLPSDALPIAYGSRGELRYYWKLDKDKIELRIDQAGAQAAADRASGIPLKNRLELVTVRIWKEQILNVNPAISGHPSDFVLKRVIDSMSVRNPDSIMKIFSTREGMIEFLNQLNDLQGGG